MADEAKKRKKQKDDPERVEKLRTEAARQRQAARIGELLRQLAAATDDADLLAEMINEIAGWAMGEPLPAELDTTWGTGAVMAALAQEFGRLRQSAGDDQFADLLVDLHADLEDLWQAAHADPLHEVIEPDPPDPEPRSKKRGGEEAT